MRICTVIRPSLLLKNVSVIPEPMQRVLDARIARSVNRMMQHRANAWMPQQPYALHQAIGHVVRLLRLVKNVSVGINIILVGADAPGAVLQGVRGLVSQVRLVVLIIVGQIAVGLLAEPALVGSHVVAPVALGHVYPVVLLVKLGMAVLV